MWGERTWGRGKKWGVRLEGGQSRGARAGGGNERLRWGGGVRGGGGGGTCGDGWMGVGGGT